MNTKNYGLTGKFIIALIAGFLLMPVLHVGAQSYSLIKEIQT